MDRDGGAPGGPSLVDALSRVVERSVALAQDELELARLEIVQKLPKLGIGLLQLVLALVLVLTAVVLAVQGFVWLIADYVFGTRHVWAAYAVVAVGVLVLAALIALSAWRKGRAGLPPVPSRAIRQAKAIREAFRR